MFFTRSAILYFLVFQLFQIEAKDTCGVDLGPPFKPNPKYPYLSQGSSILNIPWSAYLNCVIDKTTTRKGLGAVISKRYAIFLNSMIKGKCFSNEYSVYIPDSKTGKLNLPVETLKTSEKAPVFVIAKLTEEINFGQGSIPVCLPTGLETVNLVSKHIYTFSIDKVMETMRTTVRSKERCLSFQYKDTTYDHSFCSTHEGYILEGLRFGQAATVKLNGKHVLVGLVPPQLDGVKQIFYADIVKDMAAISELINDDSTGNKPSTIFEIVSKNANK